MIRRLAALSILSLATALSAQPPTPPPAAPPQTPPDDAPAAIVNGKPVPVGHVLEAFRRTRVSQQALTDAQRTQYLEYMRDVLVDAELVRQFLNQHEVAAHKQAVDEHIAKFRTKLESEGRTLEQFLAEQGITAARMRDDLEEIHRWQQYIDGNTTPKALQTYFEANRAAFDGSQVRASHILVTADEDAPSETKEQAKRKIEAIRAQLADGSGFAELATKYSDCPSKQAGGDLDFFPRKGVMAEPFAAAAYALKQGEVSQPVQTQFGYHLIMVTDRKPGKDVQYADFVEPVKAMYAAEMREKVVEQMRQSSQVEIVWKP